MKRGGKRNFQAEVARPRRISKKFETLRIRPRSNAVLHMSRTQLIEFGSCEVRRLTQLSSADGIWVG